jgi:hypothetical protein
MTEQISLNTELVFKNKLSEVQKELAELEEIKKTIDKRIEVLSKIEIIYQDAILPY